MATLCGSFVYIIEHHYYFCQLFKRLSYGICAGSNMFGGPMPGPNPGVDMLPMSSPQVGQGMHQQPLNNGG